MKSASIKKTETLTICIAIGVVAGGVLSASAQRQQDRDAERSANGQQAQPGQQQRQQLGQRPGSRTDAQQRGLQQDESMGQEQALKRASKILDMEVHGQDGQKLGDVEELVLSQDRRSIEHIKVSLDDGESIKLSLDQVSAKPGDDDVLLVQASMQELRQRQTRDLDQGQDRGRGRDRARARSDREQGEQDSLLVSKLIGLDVQGADGNDVGSINDLIIDIQDGQIKTAAVETGGFLGIGRRLASVEWQQVNFAGEGDTASINMTQDQLSENAHGESEYWDSHAFESVEGQRERGLQQPATGQRTPGIGQRSDQDSQAGQRERTPGMEQGRDQVAQPGQRERTPRTDDRQQADPEQPGQRTPGAGQRGASN